MWLFLVLGVTGILYVLIRKTTNSSCDNCSGCAHTSGAGACGGGGCGDGGCGSAKG